MSLLEESKTYKPFLYPWAVEMVKRHEEIHWVVGERNLNLLKYLVNHMKE